MATFQSEYEDNTHTIDSIVSTQLSSVTKWVNIPGTLTKASSSAAGFIWGFNPGGSVYICQLPCTGNWTQVDFSQNQISSVLDLTTDDSNVYILFTNSSGSLNLLTTAATNQGTRTVIPVPFSATAIFSTHTYIWAQDNSNHKERSAKPCNMPSWQASSDTAIRITSTDSTTLYGIDASGNAMQTNETMQSAWQPIGDIVGSIQGKASDGTLYGINPEQNAFLYDGKLAPLYTDGLDPKHIQVDPQSNQIWMTTNSPGDSGNIFTRFEKPDYSTIMNNITPVDRRRDQVVKDIGTEFNKQTELMTANKQIMDVVAFFTKMFNLDKDTHKKGENQSGNIENEIRDRQAQLDMINATQGVIYKVLILLGIVSLMYIFSFLFGSLINILAGIVLVGGIVYIANK
jgi:hypothetical protein